jgi:hypothetical protein
MCGDSPAAGFGPHDGFVMGIVDSGGDVENSAGAANDGCCAILGAAGRGEDRQEALHAGVGRAWNWTSKSKRLVRYWGLTESS